jgi:hypothetical protein
MQIETMIEKLTELQKQHPGIDVAIVDWRKNLCDGGGDPVSAGIYSDFEVTFNEMSEEEEEFYIEQHGEFTPVVGLYFESEDYDDNGNCLIEK